MAEAVIKKDWVYTDRASVEADMTVVEHLGEKFEIRRCVGYDEESRAVISWIARRIDASLSVKDNPYIKLKAEYHEDAIEEVKMYIKYRQNKVRCVVDTNRAITENGFTVTARWSISGDCFSGVIECGGESQEFWGKTWDDFVHYFKQATLAMRVPGLFDESADQRSVGQNAAGSAPSADPELVSRILNCHRKESSSWQECSGEEGPVDSAEGRE